MINRNIFKKFLDDYLCPMLGASADEPNNCDIKNSSRTLFAKRNNNRYYSLPSNSPDYKNFKGYIIQRSTYFKEGERDLAVKLIEEFYDALEGCENKLKHHDSLFKSAVLYGISKYTYSEYADIINIIIDYYTEWADQTYEGSRISCAVGIEKNNIVIESACNIKDVYKKDFGKVLTNGLDSLIVCNEKGDIIRYQTLKEQPYLNIYKKITSYSPLRFIDIAEWTDKNRIALLLNRNGEILIFKDKSLIFARRRGEWRFFTHTPNISRLSKVSSSEIIEEVYKSCIDVSFARSGGCIGILSGYKKRNKEVIPNMDDAKDDKLIRKNDIINFNLCIKSKSINKLINGRLFHSLERCLRQELLGIDGATIINHKGEIIAVGAILKMKGGSESGARLAAARRLGEYGIGIKISADGAIRCFYNEYKKKKEVQESAKPSAEPEEILKFG